MEEALREFMHSLFAPPHTATTINALVGEVRGFVHDPIAHVALRCLNEPAGLTVVGKACAFFRSDPTIVLPFRRMTRAQVDLLARVITAAHDEDRLFSSEQRGGARTISVVVPPAQCFRVDPAAVFAAIHHLLRGREDLANVVSQRLLHASVVLPVDLARARELAAAWPAVGGGF